MSLVLCYSSLVLAFVLAPVLGRALGRNAGWVLAGLYLLALGLAWPAVKAVFAGTPLSWSTTWVANLGIKLSFSIDGLGLLFGTLVLGIGAAVFVYSTRYLEVGSHSSYYLLMTSFTMAMLALVTANDLVVLFIAWEFTSLASFMLIAWSGHSGEAAAMRTLFLTFVGGVIMLTAVAAMWARFGTTDLAAIFANTTWQHDPLFTTVIAVLIALAAMTKSAQFPFHVWLPDAMAAITPISAYLHAAAVVKAGIFLLLRFSPLFATNLVWNFLLISVGLFTSLIGAWFALQQTDIKRLMAYSTVSQLGLIVATIGIGTEFAIIAAIIHTLAHALFKSGLFMMVGVIDHATHTRDLRRMPPQLWRKLPVSFAVAVVGAMSMAGLPPLLGFVSKEAMLGAMQQAPGLPWIGWLTFGVMALGAVLTFSYSAKFVVGVFFDGSEDDREVTSCDPVLLGTAAIPILLSVPFGIVAGILDPFATVVGAAAGLQEYQPHLALWHGVNLELVTTGLVVAVGLVVLWQRRLLFRAIEQRTSDFDGAKAISLLAQFFAKIGTALDRIVAHDNAFRHIFPIMVSFAAIGLGGLAVLTTTELPPQTPGMTEPIDVVLFILLSGAVLAVVASRSRLGAAVSLSAVGILMTVQILELGAPDVAMTQLLVESLGIIVIMLVLQRMPTTFSPRRKRSKYPSMVVALLAGAAMAGLVWALNGRRDRSWIAQYYLGASETLTGGTNVVNTILVEFRALDTLGELSVLGMAGIAMIALLSTVRDQYLDPANASVQYIEKNKPQVNPNTASSANRALYVSWPNVVALQLMLRVTVPLLTLVSAVLFFRGHNEPGGGFNAALVMSAIIGLSYLSTSKDRAIGPPKLPVQLIGGGILVALASGFAGIFASGTFLKPIHLKVLGVHLSSSLIFDAGVYAAVVGLIMVSVNLLGTSDALGTVQESTRTRVDETLLGDLPGPIDTVRGDAEPGRVAVGTSYVSAGTPPKEVGR